MATGGAIVPALGLDGPAGGIFGGLIMAGDCTGEVMLFYWLKPRLPIG